MAEERMRIRIRSDGPEPWKLRVEDAETGKLLPALWPSDFPITLNVRANVLVVEVALVVTEVDIEVDADVTEIVERLVKHGGIVRREAAR